jgi:hypothetical protein
MSKKAKSEVLDAEARVLWGQFHGFLDTAKHNRNINYQLALPVRYGQLDRRSSIVRRWQANEAEALRLLAVARAKGKEADAAREYERTNWGEIANRQYPRALRPQIVTKGDGGWMTWDAWLKHPTITAVGGLIFEDRAVIRG